MAIYPLLTSSIINVDVLKASSFKAGMILVKDPNNRAIKADSQLLSGLSSREKLGRILGFSASDHDINNTIIIPDLIGSSYVDSSNQVVYNSNVEYSVPKRGLLDLQDETISKFYNPSDTTITGQKGVGVYNTPGDIFITDQFNPVLHGDYGFDSTTIVSISPGDLLTFGGGVNAGKLVKVNVNSFGPDVLVVGVVEKYIVSTGLLHFRQVNYSLSFGTNPYVLSIDAGNPVSYVNGSSTTTNLVNGTSGGTLVNGTSYSSANSGAWTFDGVNDYINNTFTGTFTNSATILIWIHLDNPNFIDPGYFTGLMTFSGSVSNTHYPWVGNTAYMMTFRTSRVDAIALSGSVSRSIPHLLVITTDGTNWKMYQNNTLINTTAAESSINLSSTRLGRGNDSGSDYNYKGKIFEFNLLNQALTQTQITNYYNATRGRYGV